MSIPVRRKYTLWAGSRDVSLSFFATMLGSSGISYLSADLSNELSWLS
jgi:hypothetical protein